MRRDFGQFAGMSAAALVAALLTMAWPVTGQTPASPAEDIYTRTQALVAAVYPDLRGHGFVFMMSAERWQGFDDLLTPLSSVVFTVGDRRAQSETVATVLRAHVGFAGDESLYDFIVSPDSPHLRHERVDALGQLIVSHRDWSDAEIETAMKEAGTRFGPSRRDAVEKELRARTQAISRVLGATTFSDLYFSQRDVTPSWTAELTVMTPSGARTYGTALEPFDGRILSISRVGR